MKLDDIVLLGFVEEALKYLKTEAKENKNEDIRKLVSKLDIQSLKNDLNEKFSSSFTGANEVLHTLMNTGKDAFNEFTGVKQDDRKIINEINNLFDDSFLKEEEVKEIKIPEKKERNSELEDIVNIIKDKILTKQEKRTNDLEIKKEDVNVKEFKDVVTSLVDDDFEEKTDLPFINDDDEIYNAIKKAADHENNFENELKEMINETTNNIPYDDSVLNEIISDVNKEETYDNNEYINKHHDEYVNGLMSDLQKKMDQEKLDNVDTLNNNVEPQKAEQYTPEVHNQYVTSLMKDLQKRMEVEEEQRRIDEQNEKIYKEINDVYSHLPRKFVHLVYDAKDEIVNGLVNEQEVILLHRAKFEEIDNLRQFAEILLTHDFNVNVDEGKMIVDAIKMIKNSEGKIVSNIFEVANQTYLLGGIYVGYRVLLDEDVNI